jgi:hypothetical protein
LKKKGEEREEDEHLRVEVSVAFVGDVGDDDGDDEVVKPVRSGGEGDAKGSDGKGELLSSANLKRSEAVSSSPRRRRSRKEGDEPIREDPTRKRNRR